ncbi:hypothetical protein GT204_20225 [Streptomyces sp. SID4919]|uniref:hypothetical protein n=1 Tax=unclassified Streptomyces TaxID=2593676 RepID=UPI000823C82B|nr:MULTISPECIES: hypothetical protein [unclassified Streptomyces]MYY11173.1 hypothetical protein [Streptomyces sp. SID4919]SCK16218.1 hypothetical protein YW7DRAFT_01059 [Streptomyces sp. AmelKG-E11A]
MNLPHSRAGHRALTAVAITTGLILAVSGCGGGGSGDDDPKQQSKSSPPSSSQQSEGEGTDSAPPEQPANEVLAESKGEGGLALAITSAVRDQSGYVTVQGTVTNGTGKSWVAAEWRSDENELVKNGASIAGASLVDKTGRKKYLVLRDTEGRCLCTRFAGGVRSGDTTEWFAQFPSPPEGTTKVDFQVGSMPPAAIEISEGE